MACLCQNRYPPDLKSGTCPNFSFLKLLGRQRCIKRGGSAGDAEVNFIRKHARSQHSSIAESLSMLTEEVSPGSPRWAAQLYAILVSLKDGSTDGVSQRN